MCFLQLKNVCQVYITGIIDTLRLLFVICAKCTGNISFLSRFYFIVKTVHIICCISPGLFYSSYLIFLRIKIRVSSRRD
ncbi:hypothetical protein C1O70_17640 [Morganella morganii]|nr:hypothetical protein C1O70_17640 [Morganella morganii]ETO43751.1 hypothetical protein X965_14300 [Morganella sp. EGD-HP17]RTY19890.1 hypothetical protein EKS23_12835 [Morganella morganii subsp. morganii]CDK65574.1 hypothetical protein [Morganella morganii IS15]OAR96585.1 hypothetical protein AYO06_16980 [Morganella morganii]